MDIALYITTLLNQHNEVNIPGLGTFFKKRIQGFYDPQINSFVPPSYQLNFRLEEGNSLLLADYCCKQRKISQNTAVYFIEKFTKTIWEQLNSTGQANINPIGILIKTNNNYLLDTKTSGVNTHYYGLKTIQDLSTASVSKQPVPIITVNEAKSQTPIYEEGKRKPVLETVLSLIAFALFAILVGYYFYPRKFNAFIQQNLFSQTSSPNVQQTVPTVVTDTTNQHLTTSPDTTQASTIESDEVYTLNTDTLSVKNSIADQINYEIVGASFAKKIDAEKYVAALNAKGIAAKITTNIPGARSKVSYGSFSDKATAETELRRIRKELNPDAWIATVTPQKP